ncbi:hypothetical protein ABT369_01055 [Dactylosporangium sp. NPDC000244]|uniref:DUF6928 family protein n=1 Tax=Dactylosporangium sp. NPDC000244 TaxID=3154365 RepID=UPI0033225039
MGARATLLAFVDGDLPPALLGAVPTDPAEAEEFVRRVHPGFTVEADPYEDSTLAETYPPDGTTHVAILAGAEVLADKRLVWDCPSELPGHLLALGAGRRILMLGMHSVIDWLCFAVWEDGVLVRSLGLLPDEGIQENIGEPYPFERPFWAGEHPVEPDEEEGEYPLPFHPLELGDVVLRELWGFEALDWTDVPMRGFRTTEPEAGEPA